MDRLGDLDRTPVDLREVPETLIDAVIATEDHTFFDNPGVDVRSSSAPSSRTSVPVASARAGRRSPSS